MSNHIIYGIHVTDRMRDAEGVQNLLSEYGCYIKTRIGLHDVNEKYCSPHGVILLEMFGDPAICMELKRKLEAIGGVDVKEMVFTH